MPSRAGGGHAHQLDGSRAASRSPGTRKTATATAEAAASHRQAVGVGRRSGRVDSLPTSQTGKYAEPVPGRRRDAADQSLQDGGRGAAVTGSATGRGMPPRRPLRRSCSATGTAAATTGCARVPRLLGGRGGSAAGASRSSSRYLLVLRPPRPSPRNAGRDEDAEPVDRPMQPDRGQQAAAAPAQLAQQHAGQPGEQHRADDGQHLSGPPGPDQAATAGLTWLSRSDGATCHNPNSTDDTNVAVTGPWPGRTRPHSTPRKATSSNSTVPSGITTNAVTTADRPSTGTARRETPAGGGQRQGHRVHHRDHGDTAPAYTAPRPGNPGPSRRHRRSSPRRGRAAATAPRRAARPPARSAGAPSTRQCRRAPRRRVRPPEPVACRYCGATERPSPDRSCRGPRLAASPGPDDGAAVTSRNNSLTTWSRPRPPAAMPSSRAASAWPASALAPRPAALQRLASSGRRLTTVSIADQRRHRPLVHFGACQLAPSRQ